MLSGMGYSPYPGPSPTTATGPERRSWGSRTSSGLPSRVPSPNSLRHPGTHHPTPSPQSAFQSAEADADTAGAPFPAVAPAGAPAAEPSVACLATPADARAPPSAELAATATPSLPVSVEAPPSAPGRSTIPRPRLTPDDDSDFEESDLASAAGHSESDPGSSVSAFVVAASPGPTSGCYQSPRLPHTCGTEPNTSVGATVQVVSGNYQGTVGQVVSTSKSGNQVYISSPSLATTPRISRHSVQVIGFADAAGHTPTQSLYPDGTPVVASTPAAAAASPSESKIPYQLLNASSKNNKSENISFAAVGGTPGAVAATTTATTPGLTEGSLERHDAALHAAAFMGRGLYHHRLLQGELSELEREFAAVEVHFNAAERRASAAEATAAEATRRHREETESYHAATQRLCDTHRQDLSRAQATAAEHQTECERLAAAGAVLVRERDEARQQVARVTGESAFFRQQHADLQRELADLKGAHAAAVAQGEASVAACTALRAELAEAQAQGRGVYESTRAQLVAATAQTQQHQERARLAQLAVDAADAMVAKLTRELEVSRADSAAALRQREEELTSAHVAYEQLQQDQSYAAQVLRAVPPADPSGLPPATAFVTACRQRAAAADQLVSQLTADRDAARQRAFAIDAEWRRHYTHLRAAAEQLQHRLRMAETSVPGGTPVSAPAAGAPAVSAPAPPAKCASTAAHAAATAVLPLSAAAPPPALAAAPAPSDRPAAPTDTSSDPSTDPSSTSPLLTSGHPSIGFTQAEIDIFTAHCGKFPLGNKVLPVMQMAVDRSGGRVPYRLSISRHSAAGADARIARETIMAIQKGEVVLFPQTLRNDAQREAVWRGGGQGSRISVVEQLSVASRNGGDSHNLIEAISIQLRTIDSHCGEALGEALRRSFAAIRVCDFIHDVRLPLSLKLEVFMSQFDVAMVGQTTADDGDARRAYEEFQRAGDFVLTAQTLTTVAVAYYDPNGQLGLTDVTLWDNFERGKAVQEKFIQLYEPLANYLPLVRRIYAHFVDKRNTFSARGRATAAEHMSIVVAAEQFIADEMALLRYAEPSRRPPRAGVNAIVPKPGGAGDAGTPAPAPSGARGGGGRSLGRGLGGAAQPRPPSGTGTPSPGSETLVQQTGKVDLDILAALAACNYTNVELLFDVPSGIPLGKWLEACEIRHDAILELYDNGKCSDPMRRTLALINPREPYGGEGEPAEATFTRHAPRARLDQSVSTTGTWVWKEGDCSTCANSPPAPHTDGTALAHDLARWLYRNPHGSAHNPKKCAARKCVAIAAAIENETEVCRPCMRPREERLNALRAGK